MGGSRGGARGVWGGILGVQTGDGVIFGNHVDVAEPVGDSRGLIASGHLGYVVFPTPVHQSHFVSCSLLDLCSVSFLSFSRRPRSETPSRALTTPWGGKGDRTVETPGMGYGHRPTRPAVARYGRSGSAHGRVDGRDLLAINPTSTPTLATPPELIALLNPKDDGDPGRPHSAGSRHFTIGSQFTDVPTV